MVHVSSGISKIFLKSIVFLMRVVYDFNISFYSFGRIGCFSYYLFVLQSHAKEDVCAGRKLRKKILI